GATPNQAPIAADVSLSVDNGPDAYLHSVLHGTYTYTDKEQDAEGATQLAWLRDGLAIADATRATYTIDAGDVGHAIAFQVTPVATQGSLKGAAVMSTAIAVTNQAPTARNVDIVGDDTGTARIETPLSVRYEYNDLEGDAAAVASFRWLHEDDSVVGTDINYRVAITDLGHTLRAEVTPRTATNTQIGLPVTSRAITILNSAPIALNLHIDTVTTTSPQVGTQVSAIYTFSDLEMDMEKDSVIEWRNDASTSAPIVGTGKTYQIQPADAHKTLTVSVTPRDASGNIGTTVTASKAVENSAPQINGLALQGLEQASTTLGKELQAIYTFTDADGTTDTDASSFQWYRDGQKIDLAARAQYRVVALDVTPAPTLLEVEITPKDSYGGTGTPVRVGVTTTNQPPAANAVTLTANGALRAGTVLELSYTRSDLEGDLAPTQGDEIIWQRDDGNTITTLDATLRDRYTLTAQDAGANLTATVTPLAATGALRGTAASSNRVVIEASRIGNYVITAQIPVSFAYAHDIAGVLNLGRKGWRINEMGQVTGTGATATNNNRHYFWSGELIDVSAYAETFGTTLVSGEGVHLLNNYNALSAPPLTYLMLRSSSILDSFFGNIALGYSTTTTTQSQFYVWSWQLGVATAKDVGGLLSPKYIYNGPMQVTVDYNQYALLPYPTSPTLPGQPKAIDSLYLDYTTDSAYRTIVNSFYMSYPAAPSEMPVALQTPAGFIGNVAYDINVKRESVGFVYPQITVPLKFTGSNATLWDAQGKVANLGALPGDTFSAAFGVNNSSQVVGVSFNDPNSFYSVKHAFVADTAGIYDLSARTKDAQGLTWKIEQAFAINDAGQIVASGRKTSNDALQMLVLSPQDLAATDLSITQVGMPQSTLITDTLHPHVGDVQVRYTLKAANGGTQDAKNVHVASVLAHGAPTST
ncbi:MAG: hypothetical protein OEW08_12995, partial [Gammaproteobacteria bacterium]|nr:hypothetical protein [Gammaproteobacteria bacterium]